MNSNLALENPKKNTKMKLKEYTHLLAALSCSMIQAIQAQSHYVLIDGGGSKLSNYNYFYNDLRKAYETLKALNKDVSVYAKNGSWVLSPLEKEKLLKFGIDTSQESMVDPNTLPKPNYPPIKGKFETKKDLSDLLKAIELNEGDTIVLYFFSHGVPPLSPEADIETAGIAAWDNEISFSEIKEVLQNFFKNSPPNVTIKLITDTCFGGGIHSISRSLPNVCSAASTTRQFTSTVRGALTGSIFSAALWTNYKERNGNISFAESIFKAFSQDIINRDVSKISSFDYVDYVLKKGSYEKNFQKDDYRKMRLPIPDTLKYSVKTDHDVYVPLMNYFTTPNDFHSATQPDFKIYTKPIDIPEDLSQLHCCNFNIFSNPIESNLKRIDQLHKTLLGITSKVIFAMLNHKINSQPQEIKTIFQDVLDDMKENGARYLQIARYYEEKIQKLHDRWTHQKAKEDLGLKGIKKWLFLFTNQTKKWYNNQTSKIAQIQREYDNLKASAERDLKQYWFNHQMLERLGSLEEFSKSTAVTPWHKTKFIQLLQCEWESL